MSFNFKTASKEDRKKECDRIAKEIGDSIFFTRKELEYLPEILSDNEPVLSFTSGFMDSKTWLIALTDRRIIFLDKSMFVGLSQAVIDLDKVNSVSFSSGLLLAKIVVTDGAVQRMIDNVQKKAAQVFTNKVQQAIEASKTGKSQAQGQTLSPIEQLEKMATLLEKGILTKEEFEAQKKKLLAA
jgi:flagellar motility protein MotE (MotC chaperone)